MLRQLQNIYKIMTERFMMYFYKEKYNSFIFKNRCGQLIYDRYQATFIQKNGILNDRNDHMTIILNNEDETEDLKKEYEECTDCIKLPDGRILPAHDWFFRHKFDRLARFIKIVFFTTISIR